MKKIILILLVVSFLLTTPVWAASAFKLQVNGKDVSLKDDFAVINGRTLLPFRAFFELVGATVDWDTANRMAIGRKDGKEVKFPVGQNGYILNSQTKMLDVPAQIINNKTYIPVRVGAEAMGFTVKFNQGVINLVNPNFNLPSHGVDTANKQEWKHPFGHFSISLNSDWQVEPLSYAQISGSPGSNTVLQVKATKGAIIGKIQHYPCQGISSQEMQRALVGPLTAQGVNVAWKTERIAGREVSRAKIQNSQITALFKLGDLGFGIDVWSEQGANQNELKDALNQLIGSIKCTKKLTSDPTNGNTALIGKWVSSTYEGSNGRSAGGTTTWTFNSNGSVTFHEIFSADFYVSGYEGASTESSGGGYYRVIDDILYLYAIDGVVGLPFAVGPGNLQLGAQIFSRANY